MKDIRLTKLLLDISYNMISDVVVNIDDGNPLTKNDYDKIYCVRDCITELLNIYRDKPNNAPPAYDNSNGDYCHLTNDVVCPKCGSKMNRKDDIVLTTYPPQYVYICPKCGSRITKNEPQIANDIQLYNNCGSTSEPFEPLEPVDLSTENSLLKVKLASLYGSTLKKNEELNTEELDSLSAEERGE